MNMRITIMTAILALSVGGAAAQTAVTSQINCPEGLAMTGQCADAAMADAARRTAVVFSQPKISQTAYPVLPSGDGTYRYPGQLNPSPLKPTGVGTRVD